MAIFCYNRRLQCQQKNLYGSNFNLQTADRLILDGARSEQDFLCGITPAPPHPNIEKVSLGAEKFVEWEKCKETWRVIEELKKEGC